MFVAGASPVVGTQGSGIAAALLNNDAFPDLVVTNYSLSTNVQVLLGGSTGFSPAAFYTAGNNPKSVTPGDWNGDGNVDLAVANNTSNDISIFLGSILGTFQAAPSVSVPAGATPSSIAAGDFNRDARLDLAVANYGTSNVSILFGNGDGGFAPAVTLPFLGANSYTVIAGQFNDAGTPLDLAVTNHTSGSVTILQGLLDAGFAELGTYDAGLQPTGVVAGHWNSDGFLDLAVANYGDNNVTVMLGNGALSFGSPVSYDAGRRPYAVATGDWNGDQKADLAVANYDDNNVSILLGAGNGTFTGPINFTTGTNPGALAVADLNRDSKPDIAVVNFGSGTVTILLNASPDAGP